ncbi:sugar transferase [Aliirhizobium smilacinae]|uniref:Sugar transferase n=1 Tax=Aliirhizobium smilacinae TaxID=1395944 RepID=A0A5C4XS20_9HYPH|nr:sugar transferase [Rhizobium smilacinae]TNM65821.1 sugar transferase [Rhizobium smilacinae]
MRDVNASASESGVQRLFVSDKTKLRMSRRLSLFVKRALDVLLSLTALLVLAPLFLITSLILLVIQGKPIFIGHRRIGRGGGMFPCLKFRTMVNNNEELLEKYLAANPAERAEWAATRKLKNDPRVTPFGAFLRKSSIDEIPQLVNVVLGHMSMVGPRPIVPSETIYYGQNYADYIRVRPGLTGLWQVSGRSDADYVKRVQLDALYVANRSLVGDLMIMVKTIPAVLNARGSY